MSDQRPLTLRWTFAGIIWLKYPHRMTGHAFVCCALSAFFFGRFNREWETPSADTGSFSSWEISGRLWLLSVLRHSIRSWNKNIRAAADGRKWNKPAVLSRGASGICNISRLTVALCRMFHVKHLVMKGSFRINITRAGVPRLQGGFHFRLTVECKNPQLKPHELKLLLV